MAVEKNKIKVKKQRKYSLSSIRTQRMGLRGSCIFADPTYPWEGFVDGIWEEHCKKRSPWERFLFWMGSFFRKFKK